MADIFMSCAGADAAPVKRLQGLLTGKNYSITVAAAADPLAKLSETNKRELAAARAVIVAWSRNSASHTAVKDAAGLAEDAKKLVAISLDGSKPPLGFRLFQPIDVSGIESGSASAGLDAVLDAIAGLTGRAADQGGPASAAARQMQTSVWSDRTGQMLALGFGALLTLGLLAWLAGALGK